MGTPPAEEIWSHPAAAGGSHVWAEELLQQLLTEQRWCDATREDLCLSRAEYAAGVKQQVQALTPHIHWLASMTPHTTPRALILPALAHTILRRLTPAPTFPFHRLPDSTLPHLARQLGPTARLVSTAFLAVSPPLLKLTPTDHWALPPVPLPLPHTRLAALTSLDLSKAPSNWPLAATLPHTPALKSLTMTYRPSFPLALLHPLAPTLTHLHISDISTAAIPHPLGHTHSSTPHYLAPIGLLTALQALTLSFDYFDTPSSPPRAPPSTSDTLLPHLTPLSRLTSLELLHEFAAATASDPPLPATLPLITRAFPHLAHLNISDPRVWNPAAVANLSHLTALCSLFIPHHPDTNPTDPAIFNSLAALPCLSHLALGLSADALPALPALHEPPPFSNTPLGPLRPPTPTPLRSLSLLLSPKPRMAPSQPLPLSLLTRALGPHQQLTRLEVACSAFAATSSDLSALFAATPRLRSLSIHSMRLPPNFLPTLATLRHLTALQVTHCDVPNAPALSLLTGLQALTWHQGSDPATLVAIATLKQLTRLQLLYHLGAAHLEHLWQLVPLQRLQQLEVNLYLPKGGWGRLEVASILCHMLELRSFRCPGGEVQGELTGEEIRSLVREHVREHTAAGMAAAADRMAGAG